ncbi:MAG TPA: putative metallopeptidase [bacterium]|nr:putative metallopeptidase [bacterium]
MRWELCRKTHTRVERIARVLGFSHVDPTRIFCVRGYGSTSEAWARIWGLPTLWQQVLHTGPAYVLEIIEPEFSRLPQDEQDRVLIHELLHIPRTFSGAIRPHRTPTFRITRRTVEQFYRRFLEHRRGGVRRATLVGDGRALAGRDVPTVAPPRPSAAAHTRRLRRRPRRASHR